MVYLEPGEEEWWPPDKPNDKEPVKSKLIRQLMQKSYSSESLRTKFLNLCTFLSPD
jgi:hypothetical protein